MPTRVEDRVALRVTPLVFAAVFAMGAWADPLEVFDLGPQGATRVFFAAAGSAMVVSAVHPTEHTRFAALAVGTWACLARGLTLLIEGQDLVPRKSEIIGGSIWMACSYFVLFAWIIGVPTVRWHRDQR